MSFGFGHHVAGSLAIKQQVHETLIKKKHSHEYAERGTIFEK